MKPPFTYFGGKTAIAGQISDLLPPHEHYVEPFAGSLAVLLAKPPSPMETVNDLDGELVNFWHVLRDRTDELLRACALTPHSRAEHQEALTAAVDPVERARRTWVKLTQGRGGHTTRRTGWRYYQDPRGSHSSMPDYLGAYCSRLAPAARRLAQVSLECRPAVEMAREYGRHVGTLIYADPPYLGSARSWDNGPSYAAEMRREDEHRELAEALHGCRGPVVLSGYHSPLYDELYADWHVAEIATRTGNAAPDEAARTEVLWSNRSLAQPAGLLSLAEL